MHLTQAQPELSCTARRMLPPESVVTTGYQVLPILLSSTKLSIRLVKAYDIASPV